MALREILSSYWSCFQALLFPQLEETIGALGERHQRFVMVLEWVRVETLLPYQHRRRGCPPSDRAALARAFIAKAVFALVSTRMLLDRLRHDSTLRRLCGWRSVKHIPSEATFSRAFAEFADSALPSHLHEALIKRTQGERLAGHISRDSTAIEGRERPTPKAPQPAKPKRRRGRPRKGEERPTEPRRLERQRNMTLPEMLADLPYACDIGVKRDAKGYQTSWSGYKLHIDAADGAIPVSCLLTSASLHDSQVAIPLATLTAERVRNLYDLMDSATMPRKSAPTAAPWVMLRSSTSTPAAARASRRCGRRGRHGVPVGWSCLRRDVTTNARPSSASMVASRMNSEVAACACAAMPRCCVI